MTSAVRRRFFTGSLFYGSYTNAGGFTELKKPHLIDAMNMSEATEAQFRFVEVVSRHLSGIQLMSAGDFGYGVVEGLGRPYYTSKVEEIMAAYFNAEAAALVWGAGTGAVRSLIFSALHPGDTVVFHSAPRYATTTVAVRAMALKEIVCNYNNSNELRRALADLPTAVWLQHTPQCLDDTYRPEEVILLAREVSPNTLILCDDNYAVMRARKIGVQMGADASAFSLFKLLGPPGLGCVIGARKLIQRIWEQNSSGGSKIQGPDAMATLRALVYTPVAFALQNCTVEQVVRQINENQSDFPGIRQAYIADVNERAVLIEVQEPRAQEVVHAAWKHGAAPYPVGGESYFELVPLFYRLASTFVKSEPSFYDWAFRINPHRAGPNTVLRILKKALGDVFGT